MNISEKIIGQQSPRVKRMFAYWVEYMERHVVFWEIPGNIDIHTQGHCERVLLHALRIGEKRALDDRSMTALAHAAIFHDTRRKDNYLDVGHGGRASQYYRTYCGQGALGFLPEAYEAMKFHDRDDALGNQLIRRKGSDQADVWLEVYHVFKDADALDRLRLGTWCLDERYLRTAEAKGMVAFAQQVVNETTDPVELERMYRMMETFRP
ncbi:MAG: HD domain-containing protein [Prevotella sp.]|nr:HD domain-containing protein [Prevotella sp.]